MAAWCPSKYGPRPIRQLRKRQRRGCDISRRVKRTTKIARAAGFAGFLARFRGAQGRRRDLRLSGILERRETAVAEDGRGLSARRAAIPRVSRRASWRHAVAAGAGRAEARRRAGIFGG